MAFKRVIKVIIFTTLILVFGFCVVFLFVFGGPGQKPLTLAISQYKSDSILFFAHRGISYYYPENSLRAIEESSIRGFHAAEVDIIKSADDEFIVFHDEDGLRLLGLEKGIATLDSNDLKRHPILFEEKKSASYVATVNQLLSKEKENMLFYFDMKLSSFEDADGIAKLVIDHGCLQSVIVASSDIFFIFYMEYHHPEIVTALEGFDAGKEWTYYLMPKDLKPDFLSGFSIKTDENHIEWLKHNDLMDRRIVYGVDTGNIERVLKAGFKHIIVDYDSSFVTNASVNYYFSNPE